MTGAPSPLPRPGGAFARFTAEWLPRVEAALDALLPPPAEDPAVLHEAMRYSLFPGGKRLRPMLALAAAQACGGDVGRALVPAAALELLHTYSLIHDDLPCMDDDDLRRGRPTNHKVYGEAMALLAGDALLTLAFAGAAEGGAEAVAVLARAAGSLGMVGGQAGDILAEGAQRDTLALPKLQWIHDRKTGALITAALEIGWLAGGCTGPGRAALRRYGACIGRAFQIADDVLDVTATAEAMGKTTGKDAAAHKLTYPALLGVAASLACAEELVREALALAPQACAGPGPASTVDAGVQLLQDLALFTVSRQS
ncbi:MAG: polyprenyl synthetase family protein [Planctomycetes bacterium]|nr:polyprenyl synthetase family protein [Planctomycetota bacterium]